MEIWRKTPSFFVTTLKARLLNLPVEFMHPSNECPVFTVNTLLKPRFAAHSSVVRGRWGLWGKKKKNQDMEWVAERIRRKDKTEEWIMRNAQWDTWSWCHSSAKVGVISQETKLVFIVSLRAKRVVGKSRKWAMKGAPERWESTWFVSKL